MPADEVLPIGKPVDAPPAFEVEQMPARAAPSPPIDLADHEPSVTNVPSISNTDRWRAAVEVVKGKSGRHGLSLAFGRLVALKQEEVVLAYPKEAGFHRATVTASSGKATIEKALSEHFRRPLKLNILESAAAAQNAPKSPAELQATHRETREKDVETKIRTHPAVLATLRHLGGEVEHIQVLDPEDTPRETPSDEG